MRIMCLLLILAILTSCSALGGDFDTWKYTSGKDEFGDDSGSTYLTYKTIGVMSNSVSIGSDVAVVISIIWDEIYINLLEYGKVPANLPEGYVFDVKVKANGQIMLFKHTVKGGGLVCNDSPALIALLKNQTEPLKFALDLASSSNTESSTYQFDIDPKGFSKLYKK